MCKVYSTWYMVTSLVIMLLYSQVVAVDEIMFLNSFVGERVKQV